MSVLSENIKKFRIFRRITQQEVANSLGKSKGVISNWERGDNQPSPDEVEKLCSLFNVTPNEMFGWEENKDYLRYIEYKKANEIKLKEYKEQMRKIQEAIDNIQNNLSDGFVDDSSEPKYTSSNTFPLFEQFFADNNIPTDKKKK